MVFENFAMDGNVKRYRPESCSLDTVEIVTALKLCH